MGTNIRPRRDFARTAIPASCVVLGVILSGLVLKTSMGWTSMEMDVLRQVNMVHTPQLDWLALCLNWLFGPAVATVLVLLGTGSVLLTTRRPRIAIKFLVIVLIPTLGTEVIKLLVQRARPDIPSLPHILVLEPGGLSFPSGHTSFVACFVLAFIVVTAGRWWRPWLIGTGVVLVLLTAASRVYLGVHYPSDVAASIVYSIAAVTLANASWLLVVSHWTERRSGIPAGPAHGGTSDAR